MDKRADGVVEVVIGQGDLDKEEKQRQGEEQEGGQDGNELADLKSHLCYIKREYTYLVGGLLSVYRMLCRFVEERSQEDEGETGQSDHHHDHSDNDQGEPGNPDNGGSVEQSVRVEERRGQLLDLPVRCLRSQWNRGKDRQCGCRFGGVLKFVSYLSKKRTYRHWLPFLFFFSLGNRNKHHRSIIYILLSSYRQWLSSCNEAFPLL